jgi:hypothetical protein
MATLQTLWVIHTTSNVADSDTDEGFELVIRGTINPGAIAARIRFPNLPHDERERGRTDEYRFQLLKFDINMFGLSESEFCIRILGDDAWLPASIWIIGQDIVGRRELLASIPNWPADLKFSTDESEGKAMRCLDEPWRLLAERASDTWQ